MKIKVVVLYQVIMHYRLPFYIKMINDESIDVEIWHGRGICGTKLNNTIIPEEYKCFFSLLKDFRISFPGQNIQLPFTPSLFYRLIKFNPDIVFSEGSSSLINATIAFVYSKIFKKKFFWWSLGKLQDRHYKYLRKFINKWEKFIENKADAIFTYSTIGKNYFLSRGISEQKIFVGVNVFDTNLKLKEINDTYQKGYLNEDDFNIGFIGSIQKTKNLELLIDVVKSLNLIYGNIKLHIIGDGEYLNELKIYTNNCQDVCFYGRINYGSAKILGNCDLFVLPGLGGLAIVEGMLNKLPIITGKADGTEYDLVDENNGYIIEDMNYSNLFDRINYLYNHPDVVELMKKNSFKKIINKFSFEEYYSVYKSMILKTLLICQ